MNDAVVRCYRAFYLLKFALKPEEEKEGDYKSTGASVKNSFSVVTREG